jgi:hypothetical protein
VNNALQAAWNGCVEVQLIHHKTGLFGADLIVTCNTIGLFNSVIQSVSA